MTRRRAHNLAAAGPSGMTLVEVTVSIAMFSIVALALGSALTLASKALPDSKSANPSLLLTSGLHDRMASELFYATSVTEMTTTAITFTVADRNSDGVDETIRYAWSGVAGEPITRQYNAQPAAVALSDAYEFAIAYDKTSVKQPATYTEQPEVQIYSSGKGLLGGGFDITRTGCVGESFTASLPANTALWRVSRVRFTAKDDENHDIRVQVRKQDGSGLPMSAVVDQVTVPNSALPGSYGSVDVAFSKPASLLPSENVCVIFRWSDETDHDHPGAQIWTNNLSLSLGSGMKLVTSTNGGSTWSSNALRAVAMTVWAVPSTKDADAYQYFLPNVRIAMRSGSDASGRLIGNFNLSTQPQVVGP